MTKISKSELKRNELQEWLKLSAYYFQNNIKVLLITIISIIFIIITGSSILYIKRNNNKLSAEILSQATNIYHLGDSQAGEPSKKRAIDSIAVLKNLIEKYPNTQSAALAYYYLGNLNYQLADYQESLTYYQYFVNKYSTHAFNNSALINIANIYENQKKYDEAVKIYERLVSASGIDEKQKEALKLNLARIFELQNQLAKAKSIYSELSNNEEAQFRSSNLNEK